MKRLILLTVLVGGCSFITDRDREMASNMLFDASGCVYIQGSGGAGAGAIPTATPVPMGGGYGQGSLAAARTTADISKASCGPEGASVETKEVVK